MSYVDQMDGGTDVITSENLKFELSGRLRKLDNDLGKTHLSVRWEPGPKIARMGVCVETYNWDTRMAVIQVLLDFERDHADELAVEFDVIPLESVNDEQFAEA